MSISAKDITKKGKRPAYRDENDGYDPISYLDSRAFRAYSAEIGQLVIHAAAPLSIADIKRTDGYDDRYNLLDVLDGLEAAGLVESFQAGAMGRFRAREHRAVADSGWRFSQRATDRSRPIEPFNTRRRVTA